MVATSASAVAAITTAGSSPLGTVLNRFSVPMTCSRSRIRMECTPAYPISRAAAANLGHRAVALPERISLTMTAWPVR